MTVLQNVQLALVVAGGGTVGVKDLLWDLQIDAARSLLAKVGLQSQATDCRGNLAYGDVKRLELALALASQPRLLLMDEPTAGMAPEERFALMRLVVDLAGRAAWLCCSPNTAWMWSSDSRAGSWCCRAAEWWPTACRKRCVPIPKCNACISGKQRSGPGTGHRGSAGTGWQCRPGTAMRGSSPMQV